jgi:hypothetical protein
MPQKQVLVKIVDEGLANAKWDKLEGQNRTIETWRAKIEQL